MARDVEARSSRSHSRCYSATTMPKEILNLLTETKKQLEHVRTLGVEGIRVDSQPHQYNARPAVPPISLFRDIAPAPAILAPSNETFEQIHVEIGDCTRCPLHLERTHVVH